MINSSGGHNQFSFFNAKTGNTPFFLCNEHLPVLAVAEVKAVH